jgi:hypothetical protein
MTAVRFLVSQEFKTASPGWRTQHLLQITGSFNSMGTAQLQVNNFLIRTDSVSGLLYAENEVQGEISSEQQGMISYYSNHVIF